MEVKELRIGNSIQNLEGETYSVTGLGYDEYGYPTITTDEFETISQDPSQVQPVPLTEDRLLKLGFPKHKSRMNLLWDYTICLERQHGELFLIHKDNIYVYKLDYVHELQNIYFNLKNTELVCQ